MFNNFSLLPPQQAPLSLPPLQPPTPTPVKDADADVTSTSRFNEGVSMQIGIPTSNVRGDRKSKSRLRSCAQCRKRKMMCSRTKPCMSCLSRGEGDACDWQGSAPLFSPLDGTTLLRSQLDRLDRDLAHLASLSTAIQIGLGSSQGIRKRGPRLDGLDDIPSTLFNLTLPSSMPNGLETNITTKLTMRTTTTTRQSCSKEELSIISEARLAILPVTFGPAPQALKTLLGQGSRNEGMDIRVDQDMDLADILPGRERSDECLSEYWEKDTLHLVHPPSFRRAYATFWTSPPNSMPRSWLALYLTMLSIGVSHRQALGKEMRRENGVERMKESDEERWSQAAVKIVCQRNGEQDEGEGEWWERSKMGEEDVFKVALLLLAHWDPRIEGWTRLQTRIIHLATVLELNHDPLDVEHVVTGGSATLEVQDRRVSWWSLFSVCGTTSILYNLAPPPILLAPSPVQAPSLVPDPSLHSTYAQIPTLPVSDNLAEEERTTEIFVPRQLALIGQLCARIKAMWIGGGRRSTYLDVLEVENALNKLYEEKDGRSVVDGPEMEVRLRIELARLALHGPFLLHQSHPVGVNVNQAWHTNKLSNSSRMILSIYLSSNREEQNRILHRSALLASIVAWTLIIQDLDLPTGSILRDLAIQTLTVMQNGNERDGLELLEYLKRKDQVDLDNFNLNLRATTTMNGRGQEKAQQHQQSREGWTDNSLLGFMNQ